MRLKILIDICLTLQLLDVEWIHLNRTAFFNLYNITQIQPSLLQNIWEVLPVWLPQPQFKNEMSMIFVLNVLWNTTAIFCIDCHKFSKSKSDFTFISEHKYNSAIDKLVIATRISHRAD